ncbi:C-terminal processing peptidase [Candidatus Terasakiella magnetica]|nr:C-terminal processing peptidase [Candidatus Terasakiella magnetica]
MEEMVSGSRFLRRNTMMLVLAAALCAALPGRVSAADGWDVAEAERTIAFGYDAIVQRHLQPLRAADIAIDGLRALAGIDPQVAVSLTDGMLRLSVPERQVAEYSAPAADDSEAWAQVTVSAVTAARTASERLNEADAEQLYQAIFEGGLGKADLFSRYAGAKEAREHRSNRNGFGGIGVRFDLVGGEARIVDVIEDTPAFRAGLQAGDVILAIEGIPVRQMDRSEISSRLRGAVASDVALTVRRDGNGLQVTLRRSLIVPKTVTMTLVGGVAQIRISSFNQRTAYTLESLLKEAKAKLGLGLQGVVLDLRGNPGGLLDKAVAVADLFMAEGPIVSTRGRHPASANAFEAHPGDLGEDLAVVVLVDGRSASAAEIVASALQDSARAVVVGTNSYGKGTVQTVIRLPNDGEITLTWSRFHTPAGYALHGLGVLPTVCTLAEGLSAATVIEGLMHPAKPSKIPETLAVWRGAGLEEIALRHKLRESCPPTRRTESKVEMNVAVALLGNRAAYGRALTLSAPVRSLEALQIRQGVEQDQH